MAKSAAVVVALPSGRGSEWILEKLHIHVAHPFRAATPEAGEMEFAIIGD